MIHLLGVDFRYPKSDFHLAFEEISVELGSAAALIGPSGCGKSTLLNLIAGILTPSSGTITVNETDLQPLSDSQRRLFRLQNIGFVFQDFALIEYLNVLDNILHPWRINSALPLSTENRERARTLADQLGLSQKLHRHPSHLSQGEQQRAAICRALAPKPSVIVADEPTGNLDPSNKQAIVDILLDYIRSERATLVLATHDHELLPAFDQIIDFAKLLPTPSTSLAS
ncbi:MAG: ABC transporter ATP-binding protein [Verrucomicrobiota bacterium]